MGKTHPTQKQKKKKAKRQHSLKGKISHKLLPRPHLPPEREREREREEEEEEQEGGLLLYSAQSIEIKKPTKEKKKESKALPLNCSQTHTITQKRKKAF